VRGAEWWRGILHLELTESRQVLGLIDAGEKKLDELGKANERVRLIRTIPGIAPRTAETVVAHLSAPKRFANGKQAGAYFGLVLKQYQSGRITRRGSAVVRKLLVECSWCLLRYNGWAREVYGRLSNGGSARWRCPGTA
jgi:transposase